ncbi:bifunctional methylenetetrahydrofolate dehydrogenase/methenyltetrahydrofolate cyclohydrolase FolD [Conexibacter stalactiti]|uniref:Bifunctional protein FolD n=1 Tax=Conexibacter stalactiti TaxID=1940611 RepID=A0ABU4HND1_9ACTN|nr:bifunctional methylenetetrahydrofolate dehydrogenase/methenyltetrahydrofolate cyclohydrolase FolD [Conexibacter stalactiti]MDW5594065.1 bifunctional methylenetetrahydrofolate dehydrogenase/methenyltetrahydrofolate cyclohydrolase FolD [Conexibacter stalactiti]MEC5034707.1 bifunctional methylenetetrahydrofolate dehydrogenase/methenyltetrahydrofolate cyclohydrolase FolD [Conexibacter stalactiti]
MGFTNVYGVPGRSGAGAESPRARAVLLDGRAVAATLREETAAAVAALRARGREAPALATILVGEDPASHVYVAAKHRACEAVGIRSLDHRLPGDVEGERLAELIGSLNADDAVSGILLQLPLPSQLEASEFIDLIDVGKDVDGLTTANAGQLWRQRDGLRPCTPAGIIELLDRCGVPIAGRHAVVVGRSDLVGRPLAGLLLRRDATVTICHRHTADLPAVCRGADILVAACGIPRLIGVEHVRPGAVVVDVGITRTDDGLVGDVDFDAVATVAAAITPVPGGVGPMTIALLLANTVAALPSTTDKDR